MSTGQDKSLSGLPDVLTFKQASEALNCHPNTHRQWDNKEYFKAIRFGVRGDRLYHLEDIEKMLLDMKKK